MPISYLPEGQYVVVIGRLGSFSRLLLLNFAPHTQRVREKIIACSVARSMTCLDSIGALYAAGHHADCWVLHRTLLDRLFHIYSLNATNSFDEFYNWSYIREYEAAERVRNDPDISANVDPATDLPTEKDKATYKALKHSAPVWRRPNARHVASEMGVPFLYKFGYDYASRYVHPMGNDGIRDLVRMTGQVAKLERPVVLHNSLLVAAQHVLNCLNASDLLWRQIVYDATEGFMQVLRGQVDGWDASLVKLEHGPSRDWCRPKNQ